VHPSAVYLYALCTQFNVRQCNMVDIRHLTIHSFYLCYCTCIIGLKMTDIYEVETSSQTISIHIMNVTPKAIVHTKIKGLQLS